MPELQDRVDGPVQIGYAHGLLWAFNSLYVMVNHHAKAGKSRGSGLYRVQELDGDDKFDKITLIRELNGAGEHGPHNIIVAPDSVSLYLVSGNPTDLPDLDDYLQLNVCQADNLFPPITDTRAHDNSPGG